MGYAKTTLEIENMRIDHLKDHTGLKNLFTFGLYCKNKWGCGGKGV